MKPKRLLISLKHNRWNLPKDSKITVWMLYQTFQLSWCIMFCHSVMKRPVGRMVLKLYKFENAVVIFKWEVICDVVHFCDPNDQSSVEKCNWRKTYFCVPEIIMEAKLLKCESSNPNSNLKSKSKIENNNLYLTYKFFDSLKYL